MKIGDLDLRELLQFDSDGGIIRFGGRRAVVLDTVALGLLRKEIIETVGMTAARGVLTRFGYAHGWRTAESLQSEFPWDSEREWQQAGGRLHTLQGLVLVKPMSDGEGQGSRPFAEALWYDSFEAEQHLLHAGRAEDPVCWSLAGFASGYLSYSHGREIYCIEKRCRGQGDAVCEVEGKPLEEWDDSVRSQLDFYRTPCLETALATLTDTLKKTERRLRSRRRELAGADGGGDDPSGIIARSAGMSHVIDLARRVARVDTTVLLTGESGVGKERVARLIHEESSRTAGPFVAINCAAVTESLLESEMFGHARGAFTGATQDRAGLFEAAGGGTVLLDEVGEIPLSVQVKLLRVLQEREVRRVGENASRKVDVRVIAATNRDLAAEVKAGVFRSDLYYRLRVVEITVPPLRTRKDDILPLARVLLASTGRRLGRRVSGLTAAAADQLLRYDWPGNVRELENAVERAVALAGAERIGVDDLPEEVRSALPGAFTPGGTRPLEEVERDYILAALAANDGNRSRTADQLGIGAATLYRKLRRYESARAGGRL